VRAHELQMAETDYSKAGLGKRAMQSAPEHA